MHKSSSTDKMVQPNIQIQSSFSYNSALNSSNVSRNSLASPILSPGFTTTYFNRSGSTSSNTTNDPLNSDTVPRKRSFDHIANGDNANQDNIKRLHLSGSTTPTGFQQGIDNGFINISINTLGRKIFSCYIGRCRFRSSTSELFEKHLCYTHADQQNILRGFCELYETFDSEAPRFGEAPLYDLQNNHEVLMPNSIFQTNLEPSLSENVVSTVEHIKIKKELEENIIDGQNELNKTMCENEDIELDKSLNEMNQNEDISAVIEQNTDQFYTENTQIIPMEPVKCPSVDIFESSMVKTELHEKIMLEDITKKNCNESIDNHSKDPKFDSLLLDVSVSAQPLVPVNSDFKLPKKAKNMLRKRAMSTFIDINTKEQCNIKKKPSAHTTEDIEPNSEELNETFCLEFISKKIQNEKNKGKHDKYKNFKPNDSLVNLFENSKEERDIRKRKPRESQGDKLRKKFNEFNKMRKENVSKRDNLHLRRSTEKKEDEIQLKRDETLHKNKSKRTASSKYESDEDDLEITSILQKIKKATESIGKNKNTGLKDTDTNAQPSSSKQKSSITQYFNKVENISSSAGKENGRKSPIKKSSDTEKHEKTLKKSDNVLKKSLSAKLENNDNQPSKKQKDGTSSKISKNSNLKPTSSTSQNKSLDISSNSLNSLNNATNLSQHGDNIVADIEAMMMNASSSLEFINLKDLYPWINESITTTIFKTKASVDILFTEFALFSTYKCMNELCFFFTTDFEEFKKHAKRHDANNNYCSFCLKNFDKYADLCNHLDLTHKFDRFQCNKCMYRSCQKGFVDIHQKCHHENIENCEVFKSPVQKLMKSDRSKGLPVLQTNREKFVMPYRCKTPKCREIFYCKDNFRKHLEAESSKESYKEFITLICQQLCAIDHSKTPTNNTEGIYQCLHCQYGTDDSGIMKHMALNHPHEFAYICKRVKPQRLIELNILSARESIENSTSIEYIGTTTTEAKSFEGSLDKLISTTLENNAMKVNDTRKFLVVSDISSVDD